MIIQILDEELWWGGGSYGSFLGDGFKPDEELYIRWLQASILCPMIQFSIAPWRVLSMENYQIVKDLLTIRERYIPYILDMAHKASKEYEPIIRSMEYEFPGGEYGKEQGMYMLGDRYLVVPLLEKGKNSRTVTLSEGCWKERCIPVESRQNCTIRWIRYTSSRGFICHRPRFPRYS